VTDLADPSVLVDGRRLYLVGTGGRIYRADRLASFGYGSGYQLAFGLGAPASWTSGADVWAPAVEKFGPKRYVMFFASMRAPRSATNPTCIGRAVATRPQGPYRAEPDDSPVVCPDGTGALDPSVFVDKDGERYLLYSSGGVVGKLSPTIWSQHLSAEGRPDRPPRLLLTQRQPWERWIIENPSMTYAGNTLLLAYSTGRWDNRDYSTGIAVCPQGPDGPCSSTPSGPWLRAVGIRDGIGGLEFFGGSSGPRYAVFNSYDPVDPNNCRSSAACVRDTHVAAVDG
jgi:hypothetical protein